MDSLIIWAVSYFEVVGNCSISYSTRIVERSVAMRAMFAE